MAQEAETKRPLRSMGILNDPTTDEVPGSVLLLPKASEYNAPLGLQQIPARQSTSSLPSTTPRPPLPSRRSSTWSKKRTADGRFILDPQPTDSANDPLNWPVLRRDLSLFSLGFYSMLGGGMTPILAAGFNLIADDLNIPVAQVALTTGLYMMGLGLGSVVLSPIAILYGKRPVYLAAAFAFLLTNIWCALSPNFASLVVARIVMGFAVSSVECLPSASIAEIYFLHEKAYRLGIYTLLLLGGKNLVPLISAVIIQSLGWRWVFWIVAIIVAFAGTLLFFFVPETFWDRTPVPRGRSKARSSSRRPHSHRSGRQSQSQVRDRATRDALAQHHSHEQPHALSPASRGLSPTLTEKHVTMQEPDDVKDTRSSPHALHATTSISQEPTSTTVRASEYPTNTTPGTQSEEADQEKVSLADRSIKRMRSQTLSPDGQPVNHYTNRMTTLPPKSFTQQLQVYSGRLTHDNWFKVMARPFVLFAYPSILWSALVYALSVGWLIVLSESVAHIYEDRASYNFTPLQVGLVYISPFVGGILGTAVAGKVSDLIVRFMARRNDGLYEPEFRLVMAIPIAITTVIGLMGFGWSAAERNAWIVPTIFFGLISFGCSLGSTTAITFAVDSYRQYAGEALVTLNFSKNILHGLVWSLFFNRWLEDDGSRTVFVAIGGIQLGCLLTTIPMYIYGKRARMWTVRKNFMEHL